MLYCKPIVNFSTVLQSLMVNDREVKFKYCSQTFDSFFFYNRNLKQPSVISSDAFYSKFQCSELKIQIVLYMIHELKNYWEHVIYEQLIDCFLFLFFYFSSIFWFIPLNQFKSFISLISSNEDHYLWGLFFNLFLAFKRGSKLYLVHFGRSYRPKNVQFFIKTTLQHLNQYSIGHQTWSFLPNCI